MSKIIFFGNQKLVQGIKPHVTPITDILEQAGHQILATITTKSDLAVLPSLKKAHPEAIGVLASFGYIVPGSVIALFEPLGILNIHPSLLPKYRGSTPIETAILNGDSETGISIMKIATAMDAGPIYSQTTCPITPVDDKFTLSEKLTTLGAKSLLDVLAHPKSLPTPQTGTPTYTEKLDKSIAILDPKSKSATQLDREIRAFLGFPKSKLTLLGLSCTITKAHTSPTQVTPLDQKCTDEAYLVIDTLIPEGRKEMSATAFLHGYGIHRETPLL